MIERPCVLSIELLSDACFPDRRESRSSGESRQSSHTETAIGRDGLPVIPARIILGLLRTAWKNIAEHYPALSAAASRVLSLDEGDAQSPLLRIGDAVLPGAVRSWLQFATHRRDQPLRTSTVLSGVTVTRSQSAIDAVTGVRIEGSDRSVTALASGTTLAAPLLWLATPSADELRVLALCSLGARHGGHLRSRGLGHVRLLLAKDESEAVLDAKQRTATLVLASSKSGDAV